MSASIGFYVAGGLLALVGVAMMMWGVSIGLLTGTGNFWLGLLLLVVGIGLIAVGAGRRRAVARHA